MRMSDWSSDVCSSELRGRHQPDRGLVLASRVRADDVDRLRPIELVDPKTTIDHRHIPAEQVDEEALAVGEHGLKERSAPRLEMVFDDVDHERCSPVANTREGSTRKARKQELGRAQMRERVCPYVEDSVVAVTLNT